MAQVAIDQYLKLIPAVRQSPQNYLWSSYDAEADVLYINLGAALLGRPWTEFLAVVILAHLLILVT